MSNIVVIESVESNIVTIRGDDKEYKIRIRRGLDQFEEWRKARTALFLTYYEDGTLVFSPSEFTVIPSQGTLQLI